MKVLINKELGKKIKFIDSITFLQSLSSSQVDNLSVGLHNDKSTDCKSHLEYVSTKQKLLIINCLNCRKNNKKQFNKYLIK